MVDTSFASRTSGIDIGGLLRRLEQAPEVTVVVPVYNGGAAVERCLASLVRHTPLVRLVAIDDASTDPAIVELLDRYAGSGAIELVRHEVNQGYTRAANHALQLSAPGDVVLLNSDTEVGPGWLRRLRWVAYSDERIATVTAVSDNAGAMAVPVPGKANDWSGHLTWAEVARSVAQEVRTWSMTAPTGNGFCMYIRRAAIDLVGGFDAEAFPRGYGEENDWCMRAKSAGLSNLVAPHVLVRHARGQSFGSAREELVRSARRVIDARHPTYTADVRAWMNGADLAAVLAEMTAVRKAIGPQPEVRPRRLYVLHQGGGGTPATNRDLLTELEDTQDSYLLECDVDVVELSRWRNGRAHGIRTWRPDEPFSVTDTWRQDYAEFLTDVIVTMGIETIHVRHLIKQPLTTLPAVARLLGIPFVLSTHDFYYVCPSVHLLDEQDRYCGGTCTQGEGTCRLPTEFVEDVPPLKHRWVHQWRQRVVDMLRSADAVVATSQSAATVYRSVFGSEVETKLRIIEHGREFGPRWATLRADGRRTPGPLRVLAPAQWAQHKGTTYLRELALRVGPIVEWHVLGSHADTLADVAIAHGRYQREGLPRLAAEIDPDLVGIFSIWPETYAHTLSEAWALGIPVLATDLGAVGERIRAHGGGVLLPLNDLDEAARIVTSLAKDRGSLRRLAPSDTQVRRRATMAGDYRMLYEKVGSGRTPPVAGYVMPSTKGSWPASSYVRLLRRIEHAQAAGETLWRRIEPADVIGGGDSTAYRACVVQRDALPAHQLEAFLHSLHPNTRLAVELDDDLLSPEAQERVIAAGYEPDRLDALKRLLGRADVVLTSTEPLAAVLRQLAARVVVVPNLLDPRLWSADVPPVAIPPTNELRVLYMGTKTHERDLMLLREVMPAVQANVDRPVVLEVVGVTGDLPDESWFRRIPIPAGAVGYPNFVQWLRKHAHRWTAAVAPLVNDSVNAAKSDLKLLEYAMLGLPTVASDVGPYNCAGQLARLSANHPESFAFALSSMLNDLGTARKQAGLARDWVLANRMLDSTSIDAWCAAIFGED